MCIVILPFVMWGMGDVFRSGKQNVLLEINEEKINSKEFITYLQKMKNLFILMVENQIQLIIKWSLWQL